MSNIYWVGPRQSDIEGIDEYFAGSVTIYGDNTNGNIAYCKTHNCRINHNVDNFDCNLFFQNKLDEICQIDPDSKFLFYNFSYAYQFNNNIKEHIIGLNSFGLLDKLSDKIRCRVLLKNLVPTVPFVTLKGNECSYSNICNYFRGYEEYVIQKKYSSGGEGTFIINSTSNLSGYVNNSDEYLVSPYFRESIPLNVHIAIVEGSVILFPPSIQIVTENQGYLLYSGADFMCFDFLPMEMIQNIENASMKIGEFLCKNGYKGVLGIDFLISNQTLYFTEINPRFQASSQLLNRGLLESNQSSLFDIHMQAFGLCPVKKIQRFIVPYSNYVFTANNISSLRLQKVLTSGEINKIQMDGYDITTAIPYEKNAYLCRCIFDRNICAINRNEVRLHPNFFIEEIRSLLFENTHYKEYIKFALLNHGMTLSTEALMLASTRGTIREAVFDAIDIVIFNGVYVNVPINCKYVSLSPFTIDVIDNRFILFWEEIEICEVLISFMPNELVNKMTRSGVPYDAIINLANDRIRINPAPVCIYKLQKKQCKFCNLPTENITYGIDDIKEVIDYCLENVDFEHFLIGGGTYSLNGGWDIILNITRYIRAKCNKNIYLMSIPPKENSVLDELKAAGITEVAFNLEMFDRKLAADLMPGKGSIQLSQYMSTFKHSIKLWGKTGCVRSLLIYGFDSDDIFLDGIEQLCCLGVEPIISIFRPLENTELIIQNPPATADIITIYQESQKIAQRYSLILGPDCPQCQNNTLSYTEVN